MDVLAQVVVWLNAVSNALGSVLLAPIGLLPGWDDEDSQAALVMLAPLSIGVRDPEAVSRFTGVPLAHVLEFYGRLDENGVLSPGAMVSSIWIGLMIRRSAMTSAPSSTNRQTKPSCR